MVIHIRRWRIQVQQFYQKNSWDCEIDNSVLIKNYFRNQGVHVPHTSIMYTLLNGDKDGN